MSLTIERLNRIAEDPTAFGAVSPELFITLLDYARERAARERCEALLPEDHDITVLGAFDRSGWLASSIPFRASGTVPTVGEGVTLTEAYLALAAALEARTAEATL